MTATRATRVLAAPLRTLWTVGVAGGLSDGQLIERIAAVDGEAVEPAFELLLERHGAMVSRVCQRVLQDPNDAEDAFQATFLVLLRHAARIRNRGSAASWLHGVAARIAARAKVDAARRRRIERRGVRSDIERDSGAERRDLESLVEHELARLPEKYRAPIVLCYLEGQTHEGAADQLGWPVGTVRGRLSRARDLLRARLSRRGVMGTAALAVTDSLSNSAAGAPVPAALRDATLDSALRVAAGQSLKTVASAKVAALAEGASRLISLYRLKTTAGVLLLAATLATGLGFAMASSFVPPRQARKTLPPSQKDRTAHHREMLQLKGTWTSPQKMTHALNGVPQPPETYKLIWSIDRDTITETDPEGFAWHTYRFTLDPERTPKTIDLKLLNMDLELRGIYKLDGDTLTICNGLERPKDFAEGERQFHVVFRRENQSPAKLLPEYPNAPGCLWAVEPMTGLPKSMASGAINLIIKQDPEGALVVSVATIARVEGDGPDREYRPVAFDDKKTRYLLDNNGGGASSSAGFPGIMFGQHEYRLDPHRLSFDDVKALGIEMIPAEVRHAAAEARSTQAFQEARDFGIEILPKPDVGKPFEFTLTTADNVALLATALKGKVVLIDCWADWRSPCMGKMNEIKALYDRRRKDGFEVIGVSLNKDRGRAEQLVKTLALPWPQVYVPGDDRTRRLWSDGPGIASPHLLLIDREGNLRWFGGEVGLEVRINSLLDAPRAGK